MSILAVLLLAAPALSAAPDCTGVAPTYPTDPDLVGELASVVIVGGLDSPVGGGAPPGDTERIFVLEQDGRVRIIKNNVLLGTPFMDIDNIVRSSGDEEGLLGIAFHPDYDTNGWFFVYYTNNTGNQTISRYTVSANPDIADTGTAQIVITVTHPSFSNHNGGALAFGPDGHLYAGIGDGGSGCDPGGGVGNGQNINVSLGKLLRLNVDSLPYTTAGNPFDGITPGNDEIWSYGLRNPWRVTFDSETGAVYIGDVGQNAWEEVNCSPPTSTGEENYGWVNAEGDHCPNPSCGNVGCGIANYVPPITDYSLAGAPCTVIGGYVYRGCAMPVLSGSYFYGDYCSPGTIFRSFRTDATCSIGPELSRASDLGSENGGSLARLTSFIEDGRGELYYLDRIGGEVFKIIPDLSIMEVSGGETQLEYNADLEWEDLEEASLFPVDSYSVYRARNDPAGDYDCIKNLDAAANCSGGACSWVGGDPGNPNPGKIYFYLIVANNAGPPVTQSVPGAQSDGTLRVIDTTSVCPL